MPLKKFVKNLGFIKSSDKITIEINCKESPEDDSIMNTRSIQVVGGKLKVNWLAGERYEMKDINKTVLEQRLNLKNRKWSFKLDNQDFLDVKKLTKLLLQVQLKLPKQKLRVKKELLMTLRRETLFKLL